jgi:hypothetical protein
MVIHRGRACLPLPVFVAFHLSLLVMGCSHDADAPRGAAAAPESTPAPQAKIAKPTPTSLPAAPTSAFPVLPPSEAVRATVFGQEIVAFVVGDEGGYGSLEFTLGAPLGCGPSCGNTSSVLSLGRGGQVTLKFSQPLVDGPGADLIVFENPFALASGNVFFEPGEVSVSADGASWFTFPCRAEAPAPNGCAGYAPVLTRPDNGIEPGDVARAGGDTFDFAALPAQGPFRYVRVTDRSASLVAPTRFHRDCGPTRCGFDLDAVVGLFVTP